SENAAHRSRRTGVRGAAEGSGPGGKVGPRGDDRSDQARRIVEGGRGRRSELAGRGGRVTAAFKHGPKPVIGLLGAIGAGKSTAAKCFAARSGHVINADALGHEALRQPEIVAALIKRWGERVQKVDGSLDRWEIGRIVFADPAERNALEATVFPYIEAR